MFWFVLFCAKLTAVSNQLNWWSFSIVRPWHFLFPLVSWETSLVTKQSSKIMVLWKCDAFGVHMNNAMTVIFNFFLVFVQNDMLKFWKCILVVSHDIWCVVHWCNFELREMGKLNNESRENKFWVLESMIKMLVKCLWCIFSAKVHPYLRNVVNIFPSTKHTCIQIVGNCIYQKGHKLGNTKQKSDDVEQTLGPISTMMTLYESSEYHIYIITKGAYTICLCFPVDCWFLHLLQHFCISGAVFLGRFVPETYWSCFPKILKNTGFFVFDALLLYLLYS